jgi:hypothetical protein
MRVIHCHSALLSYATITGIKILNLTNIVKDINFMNLQIATVLPLYQVCVDTHVSYTE